MLGWEISVPGLLLARRAKSPADLGALFWFAPNDAGSVFQDSAETQPVSALDDRIHVIRDKSGAGRHLRASAPPERPLWKQGEGWDNGAPGLGLRMAQDVNVREVFMACRYEDGVLATFSEYKTLMTDLAGIDTPTPNRVMGRRFEDVLHVQTFEVQKPGAAFGVLLLPLPMTVLRLRRKDGAAWPVGAFGTTNNANVYRPWTGRIGGIAGFDRALSDEEASAVVGALS
ncbi:MAG: hypothetical protein AAFP13_03760 [Pseudomonadota bacterium]